MFNTQIKDLELQIIKRSKTAGTTLKHDLFHVAEALNNEI